eukprot:4187198-Alexandrium_andersonii.AAC.1
MERGCLKGEGSSCRAWGSEWAWSLGSLWAMGAVGWVRMVMVGGLSHGTASCHRSRYAHLRPPFAEAVMRRGSTFLFETESLSLIHI